MDDWRNPNLAKGWKDEEEDDRSIENDKMQTAEQLHIAPPCRECRPGSVALSDRASVNGGMRAASGVVEAAAAGGKKPQSTGMPMSMGVDRPCGGVGRDKFIMMMMGRKKRGQPRKYDPDESMALGLSPGFSSPPRLLDFSTKRGRGRPPSSGKRHLPAALGDPVKNSSSSSRWIPKRCSLVSRVLSEACIKSQA
ncbi:hypothetical protein ACLOJK_024956 [Asimina triloba]